jgi:hypothetical protein
MLGAGGQVGVVRDVQDRESPLPRRAQDDRHHLFCAHGVQLAGDLVGQQQIGLVGQRHCDRYPLCLAAGKSAGQMVEPMGEAYFGEQVPGHRRCPGSPAKIEGELDVLDRGEEGNQVPCLENDADAGAAEPGKTGVVEPAEVVPVENDSTRLGAGQTGDDAEKGRLPTSRSPDQTRRRAASDIEVCAAEHLRFEATLVVGLDNVNDPKQNRAIAQDDFPAGSELPKTPGDVDRAWSSRRTASALNSASPCALSWTTLISSNFSCSPPE